MSDRVKYERLQDLKASISGRQGVFVYAPVAQQGRVGIVKGSDSVTVNGDGSIEVSVDAKSKFIQVLSNIPSDLSPYEGSLFVHQSPGHTDVLYKVIGGQLISTDLELDEVKVSKVTDAGSNVELRFSDSAISTHINGVQHIFGYTEGTTFFPFHYNKSQVDAIVAGVVSDIETGATVAKKAERDSLGNVIKNHYVTFVKTAYNDNNNSLSLEPYNGDDSPMPTRGDAVILPKATTSKDGLMAKEDKVYVDGLPSALLLKENKSEKGVANGYASLDGGAKIHTSQLPDSILGQLEYKGTFNPSGGYPINPEKGWFYISVGNASISGKDYKVGDWAVYNGSSWDKVDNTDAVASVNGKLGAVVLYGTEIQVGNGDTWTVEQRIVNIYAELNNRYTKSQTYTNTEIEQRLTDLLGMANLQDILIGSYTNGQTVLASDLSPYNFVIVLGKDVDNTYTGTFKPSEIVNGNVISLSSTVYLTRGATNFTITTPTSVKLWGIKLDGIDASEIAYDGKTVEDALNEIFVPAYITATHEALQTEITATDAFEINDDTGDVVKITGNGPSNLLTGTDNITSIAPFGATNSVNTVSGGKLINTGNGGSAIPYPVIYLLSVPTNTKIYVTVKARVTNSVCSYLSLFGYDYATGSYPFNSTSTIYNPSQNQWYVVSNIVNTPADALQARFYHAYADAATANGKVLELDYIRIYNVDELITKGIKADDGRLLAALTDSELRVQMDVWVENGFPTVVEKLVSKSDNLFNAEFKPISDLRSENLMTNGDFVYNTDWGTYKSAITVSNGIATVTGDGTYPTIPIYQDKLVVGDLHYLAARGRVLQDGFTQLRFGSGSTTVAWNNPVKEQWYSTSNVAIATNARNDMIGAHPDATTTAGLQVQWDYSYVYNISDLVRRGVLPGGLTNAQYKTMIDTALFENVPLRETNYIAVEPSKAYKLIKASTNEVTHKVIEYTTDNQVVKVTPVVYTTNKFTFTTHALTSKIKIVSDLMDRPNKLIPNSDFSDGVGWSATSSSNTIVSGNLVNTGNGANATPYASTSPATIVSVGMDIYTKARFKVTNAVSNHIKIFWYDSTNAKSYNIGKTLFYPSGNTWYDFSDIASFTANGSSHIRIYHNYADAGTANGKVMEIDYVITYNITEFKDKGVKDDSGTLFSRLTNDEITYQMDIWTEVGFPDHVIAALYPNGVDSAIALKYNDADDIFRPQQVDTLPLNLTLRSGEYWQDGYVVKQNGNAEYYPLNTKFSAWNYGQLEAVYTSGVPADFDIRYAQNTAGQVKTTQEFLVEAREQLDYVTEGYDNLVEKLGDAIFSDTYDSYAGITSDTYEYYTLEGIKEGNTLAIEGAGQSIQNLLGKGGTINATTTVRGVTVVYDDDTGVFTANGTSTAGLAFNITLATGMDFGLPVGTPMQLMRYYDDVDGGTVNLNGSYIGYVLLGTTTSNRINENSEALYDPYINGSGNLKANHATNKQQLLLQVWAPGIVFTNFKFKVGIYEGLQLRPFILPFGEPAKSNVTVYNRTANMLNMSTALNIEDSGLTLTYDPLVQEFLLSGTATATKDISLSATFNVSSGDRLSIKRLYQSGDVTAVGGTLPRLKLVNSTNTTIVYNDIYKMTAPEGETPTPDVNFNTGTAPADATLTLKLGITSGQVLDNYRFRLMIHDKSTDIGYVAYRRDSLGNMSVGVNERAVVEFKAIPYGILEFVADSQSLNLLYADSITDLNKTYLEYNAGIISPNRKISELTARAEIIDNPFRNKVIAVWGDSRESNNPTSDPTGVGDQKDTSWPALLAKKLSATVLNYGLSGGAWAENTAQQDAASAIVNRVQTEDISASADVIIISSMNDFKLASVLGSPLPANKDKTTFYGAMRLTYDRLATKYPGKKIVLVLPQKRYDETVNYGGGSYYHYLKAQVEVAKEYGIPIVDLYHNFPNAKPTFYATTMLNDTHFSAVGNDMVAELVARELIGNGNKGDMDLIPPIPTTDGTYTLKVTITGGIPTFSWVVDN